MPHVVPLLACLQWKVRRTLAFSIHELAVILGDQLTAADLVPIFNGFLKDLDEVRIGVLKHLYDFLKVGKCNEFLSTKCFLTPLYEEFLNELCMYQYLINVSFSPMLLCCVRASIPSFNVPHLSFLSYPNKIPKLKSLCKCACKCCWLL